MGGMDHSLIPPDTDFKDLFCWIGDQMELDLFVSRDWREIDLVIENSDSAIAIHGSGFTEAEDVLGRSVRLGE